MKVLLVNPPYQTLTSNLGVGHQVPLGLLMVGGALLDAGHEVVLLDAEARKLKMGEVVARVEAAAPDAVRTGGGEGEARAVERVGALEAGKGLEGVRAVGFRDESGEVRLTGEREPLDLNAYRVGWELIEDWDIYRCFGLGRAAIAQFSRG